VRPIVRIPPALGLLLLASTAALADEQPITLKDAPGHDVVEAQCGACHSLDYIRMNSPFPAPKTWEAEVNKMIHAFGAPIGPEDARTIVDYLSKNYATAPNS
jgi:sulfite dehydrogenase (cytochrome) subunit B